MAFTFLGVDLSGRHHPFSYIALNDNCKLLAFGQGDMDEVLAFAAGLDKALASVNAPSTLNKRKMADESIRLTLNPQPQPGKYTNIRRGEYELLVMGIKATQTPADKTPPMIQHGLKLYRSLEFLGYSPFSGKMTASRHWVETPAEACYFQWLGHTPLDADTLEGRLQRQLVLKDFDLPVKDPMDFFEEITSHKLRKGNLPMEMVLATGLLNAWASAYAAWLAVMQPEQVKWVGDPEEGLLLLPSQEARAIAL